MKLSYHHLVILVRLEIKWWGHPQGLSYRPLNWPPAETRRGHWLTARCSCHRGRPRRRVAEYGLIALYQWNPEAWSTGWGRNLKESAAVMSRNSNTFRYIERKRERHIDNGFNISKEIDSRLFFLRKYHCNVFFCVSRIYIKRNMCRFDSLSFFFFDRHDTGHNLISWHVPICWFHVQKS